MKCFRKAKQETNILLISLVKKYLKFKLFFYIKSNLNVSAIKCSFTSKLQKNKEKL